jgi:hypothetical protein
MQISNYTVFAGILCVAVSVYLGVQNVNINAAPFPVNFAGWVNATPKILTFFIKGIETLVTIGLIIVLFGRSIRLYFERDSRMLRNIGLMVTIGWFRWILDATANVIYNPKASEQSITSLSNPFFSVFIYTILVGLLIGIASVLLILIINRSSKDFFVKTDKNDKLDKNDKSSKKDGDKKSSKDEEPAKDLEVAETK